MIEHDTQHVDDALRLFLDQFKERPRLAALLSSYIQRVQDLEDAAWDVLVKRLIDNAEAAQLDAIGRIVGEVRDGRDDPTFRLFVLARIRINKSFGHADDVIDVLRLVEAADFTYLEVYPASAYVDYLTDTSQDAATLIALARLARASGTRLQLLYGDHDIGVDGFSLCTGTTEIASTTEGLGISDASTGGYLSGVLE